MPTVRLDIDMLHAYVFVTDEDKEYEAHLAHAEMIKERSKQLTRLQALRLDQALEEAALIELESEV